MSAPAEHRARRRRARSPAERARPAAGALALVPYRRGGDDEIDGAAGAFRFSTFPDGWRCLVELENGRIRVRSRAGHDLAPALPRITAVLATLAPARGGGPTVLDGILRLPPPADVPAPGLGDVVSLLVIDALCVAGVDLRARALDERQDRLRALRWPDDGAVVFERAWRGDARSSLAQLQSAGRLAGGALLARRAAAPYDPERDDGDWLVFGEPDQAEMLLCGVASSGALVLGRPTAEGLVAGGVTWPTRRWRALALRCRPAPEPLFAFAPWPSLGTIAWAEPDLWLLVEADVRAGSGRSGPRWRLVRVQEDLCTPASRGDRDDA